MFDSILIANRGEIACRIMRTAKRLGIRCIAVYSAIDADALHVKMADAAYLIGPAPSRESYLNINAILNVAKQSGAQAIHPGYGFLSENAEFAEQCKTANIIFIGPSPTAIRTMGDKIAAKKLLIAAGIPVTPGYHEAEQNDAALFNAIKQIGFPVLLKAAAGGGGKGMRLVQHEAELEAALVSARREAKSSFGDERIFVEKYLPHARHIEVQVFADQHKNVVHLFERDCSLQRRHQKVIEETPPMHLSPMLREQLGKTAVTAARAINYLGAGTIEFLVNDEKFYFMEMNTRLQVEHPITEMTTQIDLVEWQLRVAAGEVLPLAQKQIVQHGHAIEARVYAENPQQQFLPSIGKLIYLQTPQPTPQVRIDSGVIEGDEISIYYDPLIAKLVVWGETREIAIHRLHQALAEYQIVGVTTNIGFLQAIIRHPFFNAGQYDTQFITTHMQELLAPSIHVNSQHVALACLYLLLKERQQILTMSKNSTDTNSPWWQRQHWRLNLIEPEQIQLLVTGQELKIAIWHQEEGFILQYDDSTLTVSGEIINHQQLVAHINGQTFMITVVIHENNLHLFVDGQHLIFTLATAATLPHPAAETATLLTAPMPGTIAAVSVTPGQSVTKGQSLLVLEAMKMEHTIYAPADGTVKAIPHRLGEVVQEGAELVVLESPKE